MAYVKIANFADMGSIMLTCASSIPYTIRATADDTEILSDTLASGSDIFIDYGECYIEVEPLDPIITMAITGAAISENISDSNILYSELTSLTITNTLMTTVNLLNIGQTSTFVINNNSLLTNIIPPNSVSNVFVSANFTGNALTGTSQNAIINAIWNCAIINLLVSKTFAIQDNAGTPSAQSEAYLTALNDAQSFNWTINGVSPAGSGTVHIKTAADLQTLAVNLAADAVCDNHIEGAITHTWGADVPDYTLVIPSTITTGTLAAITNGAITINGAAQTVCGVYFDTSKVLAGFYVTGNTSTAGAIAQSTTFASDGCAVYPIKHFYRDLPAEVYATEKAKIFAGTLYDITEVDGLTYQPLVYNDNLKRIYYRGQIIAVGGVQAKSGFVPIGQSTAFTGNFDCKGYTISDCHVFSNLRHVGVLGNASGSGKTTIIQSVGHTIVKFGYISTDSQRLGLIGTNESGRIVNNSYSTGSTSGTGTTNTFVGGLVGLNILSPQFNNSYSSGSTSGTGNSHTYVGGLVGYNISSSQVNNSYSTGSTSGIGNSTTFVGGLVGYNNVSSQVNNSFGFGNVSGTNNASALVVSAIYLQDASSSATNVYQLGQVEDYTVGGFTVCKGLTAAQFKDKANFATVTANYTGLAGITTHSTTGVYLPYTIVYNSTRTALYICNTAITTGTVALTDERWQELVFNEIEQVIFTDYLYTEDETGLVIKARETGSEDWITISVHNPTYRTYANTERVITADGKCYVALQNVPLTEAITNTAYWLEDTGYNFNTIWRMGANYPKLRVFLHWIKNRTNRMIKHLYFGA